MLNLQLFPSRFKLTDLGLVKLLKADVLWAARPSQSCWRAQTSLMMVLRLQDMDNFLSEFPPLFRCNLNAATCASLRRIKIHLVKVKTALDSERSQPWWHLAQPWCSSGDQRLWHDVTAPSECYWLVQLTATNMQRGSEKKCSCRAFTVLRQINVDLRLIKMQLELIKQRLHIVVNIWRMNVTWKVATFL